MIMDKTLEFADATALNTGGAATYNVGNVIDTGVARDVGGGQPMYMVVQVSTAATSGGSATIQFQLVSDSTGTIDTAGTQTIHGITSAIPVASLILGAQYVITLPPQGSVAYERFLAVQQVTAVAALTAGAVDAFLTFDPPANFIAMPDGDN